MDKDQLIHDLIMLELSKLADNLTPNEIVVKYFELLPTYEKAYKNNKPVSKAKIGKKSVLGL